MEVYCYFFKYDIMTRSFVKDKTLAFPEMKAGITIKTRKNKWK